MTPTEIDPRQLQWAVLTTVGLAVAACLAHAGYAADPRLNWVGFLALGLTAFWFAALMVVMLTAGFRAWQALLTLPVVIGVTAWIMLSPPTH